MKKGREIVGALLAIAIVMTIGVLFIGDEPTISGFTIFSDGCASTLNTSGVWELNASLSCPTGDAITVTASDVTFNCQNNPIVGAYDSGSSAFIFADSLTNISILNCNITAFADPITVGTSSNLSITATHVEANASCVTGAWANGGSNTGCLVVPDTTAPTLTLVNQTGYTNSSLSYQVVASDSNGISSYTLNGSTNASFGAVTFVISTAGIISNSSALTVGNYTMLVNVSDPSNNSAAGYFNVHILTGTSAPPEEEDEEDEEDEDSDEESSSSSGGSQGATCVVSDWSCTSWGACGDDGFERRVCSKIDEDNDCVGGLPATKRECVIEETSNETDDIADAEVVADPEALEQEGVTLTGGVISPFERITNSFEVLRGTGVIITAVAVLVIGFVLTLVLGRRMREQRARGGSTTTPRLSFGAFIKKITTSITPKKQTAPSTAMQEARDNENQKLWDWEEKNK